MLTLKEKSLQNEELAHAIGGQTLLHEGSKKVTIVGKNVNSVKGKRKCAFVGGIVFRK